MDFAMAQTKNLKAASRKKATFRLFSAPDPKGG